MPVIVTAAELAAELGTDPKRLGRWLRAERKRGHALMAGRAAGARWEFTREQATQLAEEFWVSAARGQVSDSAVQRKAEAIIRDRLAEHLGMPLEPREIKLAAGASVHVDAVSADGTVLAEIFARQGELKGGQQKKVAIDTLKLITIRRERSEAKLYITFADQEASRYATGGGWVAQALRTWKVDVVVIDIPPELRDEIRAAQEGQRMVNPDEAGDVAVDDEALAIRPAPTRCPGQIADATRRMTSGCARCPSGPSHPVNALGSVSAHYGPTILSEHDCVMHYARFLADGQACLGGHAPGAQPRTVDVRNHWRQPQAHRPRRSWHPGGWPPRGCPCPPARCRSTPSSSSPWPATTGGSAAAPRAMRVKVDQDVDKVAEYLRTGLAARG